MPRRRGVRAFDFRFAAILAFFSFLSLFTASAQVGNNLTLAWNLSADPNVAGYRLFYGVTSGNYSNNVDAGNASSVTIPGFSIGVTYYFAINDYDGSGDQSPLSPEISYTIPATNAPPVIITQPASSTNVAGTTITLGITVIGTVPMNYQWQFNGANLPTSARVSSVTSPTLTISNLQTNDAGNYSVLVGNGFGNATSSNALLVVTPAPPAISTQPSNSTSVVGTTATFGVTATGTSLSYQWQLNGVNLSNGGRVSGVNTPSLTITGLQITDSGSYSVVLNNSAGSVTSSNASLTVIPLVTDYVTGVVPGTLRNDFSGYVGMEIVVGSTPLTVSALGRIKAPGNTGTHILKLVNFNDGTDVPGGAATITMGAGAVGQFQYVSLAAPILLSAGNSYYVVSQELQGGDLWYDYDTTVSTTSDAAHNGAFWGYGPGQWHAAFPAATFNQIFVPVDFTYSTNAPPPPVAYVTSTALGTLRNDFSGYVGMKIVVGSTPLTVTALGRITAPGNNGTHSLKIVNLSDGTDVTGGSASVTMTSGPVGQFQYASLANPVTLAAGIGYYVMSQETKAGDYWYDYDTTIANTAAATHNGAFWGYGPGQWFAAFPAATPSQSFVPVDFKYQGTALPPSITAQPTGATILQGATATFSVSATGTAPLSYQWQSNGVNLANSGRLSGVNTATLTIASAQTSDTGGYGVILSNASGVLASATAPLIVVTPPSITSQPVSVTNLAGSTASFAITASGTAPLAYQWQSNGVNLANGGRISGATSPALTIANLLTTDAASYGVIVSNSGGVLGSSNATLTIVLPPGIATQPVGATNLAGTTVSFVVTATGTAPLSYQWQSDGVNLVNGGRVSGVTTPSLSITGLQATDAGSYSVFVSNAAGSTNSAGAFLAIAVPPAITTQPVSSTNVAGATASFNVTATGSAPLTYQWRSNGVNLANGGRVSGVFTPALTITSLQSSDAASYSVVVSNVAGTTNSTAAALTVTVPPTITAQPASVTNLVGATTTFTVSATGTAPLSYQWQSNGVNLVNAGRVSGVATPTLTVTAVQPSDAANYGVVISNVAGITNSSSAALTVTIPPAITAQPVSITNAAGTTASFAVTATGTGPLSYQWQSNGVNLVTGGRVGGATAANLTITGVQATDAGNYSVIVSNVAGVTNSASAALSVVAPPAITAQPLSVTNVTGTTANFSVTATGTAPLSYQWQSNGVSLVNAGRISGVATPNLTITGVQPSDAANYGVVISNIAGITNSSSAALTVTIPPTITAQPASITNVAGTTASFAVTATGTGPLSYQWQSNGVNLVSGGRVGGATAANLTITGVQATDAGNYSVIVSNVAGVTNSASAALSVAGPPTITAQPLSVTNVVGTTANFSVTATGTAPLSYQWQSNGVNLVNGGRVSGVATPNLAITGVQSSDAANYGIVISNVAGITNSSSAALTVTIPPAITAQPASITNVAGTTASFTVTATGTGPLSYQWQSNGVNLVTGGRVGGATAANLTITGVQSTDAGNYSVIVSNVAGLTNSVSAVLSVAGPPAITVQPLSVTNVAGTTANFSVTATGTAPLSYQWQSNGVNLVNGGRIGGVTSSNLTITGVQTSDSASYSVTVSNLAGILPSSNALLTVTVPPAITAQPINSTNLVATTATFTVTATGTAPLSYQWRSNGVNLANGGRISGATSAALTINTIQSGDAANYSVLITNVAGTLASSNAALTVLVPPAITAQPVGLTNNAGTTATFSVTATGTAPLSYQWQSNGVNLANGIRLGGVTSPTLTISSVQTSDVANYSVIVSNAAGSLTSSNAPLGVNPASSQVLAYVTGTALGTLRHDFSGYVGMKIIVGTTPLTVASLGRIRAAGNNGAHLLKIVSAADGTDVLGGTASIVMSAGTVGQFQYTTLASPVILAAGSAYYLMSQETQGGDFWYDYDTTVTTTTDAVHNGAFWGVSPGQWNPANPPAIPSQTFVPVDFTYSTNPPPAPATFVTGTSLGTPRHDFTGFVGMQITVGASPITVSSLGRIMAGGNNGSHILKLVNVGDGTDVAGGSATITMGSGTVGLFQYVTLATPVILSAGGSYYVVSQEFQNGDYWYDYNTTVTTTAAATHTGAFWGFGPGQWNAAYPPATPSQTFVPVDFAYTTNPLPPAPYVTSTALGSLRNNYNGYVGMKITVGSIPLTVTALGRMVAGGNSSAHTVKFVNVATGIDVPGATTSIVTSAGSPGQFLYGTLASPITLTAGTSYYLVSQEVQGGDNWFDYDTTVNTTSVATHNGAVWGFGPGQWFAPTPPGTDLQTYVPVDFKCTAP